MIFVERYDVILYRLIEQEIRIIEEVLTKGLRVEIIPIKDRVKIIEVKREDVSPEYPIIIKEQPKR